jgi:hypothetical protein
MRNLFEPEVSQSTVDDLYNGTLIPRKTRPVAISGTGIVKRGTPLASEDGETFTVWQPGKRDIPIVNEDGDTVGVLRSGEIIRGILLSDIDTSETEEAENAVLGISGEFNRNKIEEALGEELDAEAIMEAWGRNIHIETNKTYPAVPEFPLG